MIRKRLETLRLALRPFAREDLYDWYEYCSQEGVGEAAGWKHHDSLAESAELLEAVRDRGDMWAVEYKEGSKVVGHISVQWARGEQAAGAVAGTGTGNGAAELGFALNQEYQGRGLMTEAVCRLAHYLLEEGADRICACCLRDNMASARLLVKCGFVPVREGRFYSGTLGREFLTQEYELRA